MLFKTALLCLSVGAFMNRATAQLTVNPTEETFIKEKDKETHASWRKGKHQFPARPRDMWQVGLGGGSFLISGDVKPQFGWGASIHARKSFGYVLSTRLEYMFGQARGLNYQASDGGAYPQIAPFPITVDGQTVVTPGKYDLADPFYMNYKMGQYHALSMQAVINLNNIRFHRPSNKWSLNWIIGVGVCAYNTRYDALDKNGNAYDFSHVADGLDATTLGDRRTIRDNVKGVLDGEYETLAMQNRRNMIWFGKGTKNSLSVMPFFNTGLSLEYLVTPRLSIALEHQVYFTADDYMDGFTRQLQGVLTPNSDIPHYTSVRLGFHLGKKSKRIQPLWFVNPLLYPNQDIADLKQKLDDDWFKDDDDDGVPNKLDKEPNTAPNTLVDTKGRTLDSDGDKIPDSQDKEPFSPPGYPADANGIAQAPKPIFPKDIKVDGQKLVIGDETYDPIGSNKNGASTSGMKEWYLPMIHFDLDKYNLRPEAYGQLAHVGSIMTKYPDVKIVVYGHTDSRASEEYNDMLSYNRVMSAIDYLAQHYGINRNRFVIQFNGKRKNLIDNARREEEHFMNRRVEFFIANDKDLSQPKPNAPKERREWKY